MSYDPPSPTAFDLSAAEAYIPPSAADFVLGEETGPQYQTPPAVIKAAGAAWNRPAARRGSRTLGIDAAAKRNSQKRMAFGRGAITNARHAGRWDESPQQDTRKASEWGRARTLESDRRHLYDEVPQKDIAGTAPWEPAARNNGLPRWILYNRGKPRDEAAVGDFGSTRLYTPRENELQQEHVAIYSPPETLMFDLSTGEAYTPPAGIFLIAQSSNEAAKANIRPRPTHSTMGVRYDLRAEIFNRSRTLPWGRGQYYRREREWGIDYPTYDGPVGKEDPDPPEIKLSYIIMNIVNVVKLPDETPVWIRDISIDLDIDSWSWRMSGTVKGQASLDQIKPTASGPVDIRVTINGHAWVFMVERYTGDRRVGEDVFQIQAVSRTQYLARPYAPKRSKINGADINAKQAMNEELENTGFTLDWVAFGDEATPDWTIPAGALAYVDKTPMEAIKMIADAAGAIVVPAPDSDTLTIKPRFPTPPWGLDTATMDRVVHHSMIRSISEEWRPSALYNAAYVSGISYGRGTMVTRQGTAGDKPAPDTVNELQVAVECNRHRGEMLIADSGNRSIYTMDLHIPESATAPGLILPGHEVEFQGQTETWRGYVLATTITASGPGAAPVWQQITINRPLEH